MKRIVNLVAVLFFVATMPAFALQRGNEAGEQQQSRERRTVVDEVIRMSHAGLGDEEIIAFIQQSRGNYVISADEMIAMAENKVSRDVMKTVIHEAADRRDVYAAPQSDRRYDDGNGDNTTHVVVEHSEPYYYPSFSVGIGLYAPYYGYGYYGYGYPYYGYGYPYYGYGYYGYSGYHGHGYGYSHGGGGHGYHGGGGG